ncbi:hypothetical protein M404DRAFT_27031 [Pisolithus tinctorius Marx 270]|uniref:Uncharacterized protein n=1 Tax=Pisolithus tinctorius Marx 270 TaxID=870435 RepID=A0A0C3P718_PISTI|nr:hypothetical protein M404DRAFT_27031 [Pisolithus tinctorius Marx 270]
MFPCFSALLRRVPTLLRPSQHISTPLRGGSTLAEPNALSPDLQPLTSGSNSDLSLRNFPSYPSAHCSSNILPPSGRIHFGLRPLYSAAQPAPTPP